MKNQMIVLTNDTTSVYFPSIEGSAEAIIDLYRKAGRDAGKHIEGEFFNSGRMPLEKLPEDVRASVRRILKVYDSCNVYFENGVFHAHASVGIKSSYNWDHFVCGNYLAKDVYTEEERRRNYKESFDSFVDTLLSI